MTFSIPRLCAIALAALAVPTLALGQGARLDEQAHAKGRTEAPAAVAAAGLTCTLTDARYIPGDSGVGGGQGAYEVACRGTTGRILLVGGRMKYQALDCLATAAPYADGTPNPLACRLPDNLKALEEAHKRGQGEAPALVAALGAPCKLTDARYVLTGVDPQTKTRTDAYELACDGALGRVVLKAVTGRQTKYQSLDCLAASAPTAGSEPNQLTCLLPANARPLEQLRPYLAQAGLACDLTGARSLGTEGDNAYFEAACAGGRGYVLRMAATFDPASRTAATNCLAVPPGDATDCKLTARDTMLAAAVTPLMASADSACQVSARRYVLSNGGDEYYEVACASGRGLMVVADAAGAYKSKVDCDNAGGIGGGCALTDIKAARTADNARYARLVRAAGYDCAVSGYRPVAASAQDETVEVACANRPDGALAQFPKSGAPRIFNCAAAQTTGYRCTLTGESAAFGRLTEAVKKAHPTSSCQVSAAKFLGVSPEGGFVEVACADRAPGYVLQYAKATGAPAEALYCSQLRPQLGVTCSLPTNLAR